jgi:hypothetical protein
MTSHEECQAAVSWFSEPPAEVVADLPRLRRGVRSTANHLTV